MTWYPFAAFAAQFCLVFLLGMQVANIRDRNYLGAFITSLTIGACEISVVVLMVRSIVTEHGSLLVYGAFMFGGACGIVTSMRLSDMIEQWRRRIVKRKH